MKKIALIGLLVIVALLAIGLFALALKERAESPKVITKAGTGVSANQATFNMEFTLGDYSSVDVRFQYRVQSEGTWIETTPVTYTTSGSHSDTVTGLIPETTYEFKAVLQYDAEKIYGDTLTFTTGSGIDVYDIFDHISEVDLNTQQFLVPFSFNTWPNFAGKTIMCLGLMNPTIGIIDEPDDVNVRILKVYIREDGNLKDLENFDSLKWQDVERIGKNLYAAQGSVLFVLFEIKTGNFIGEKKFTFGFKTDNSIKYSLVNVEISNNLVLNPEQVPDNYEIYVHGIQYELNGISYGKVEGGPPGIEGEGYFHQGHPLISGYLNSWISDKSQGYEEIIKTLSKEVDSLLNGPPKVDGERYYVPLMMGDEPAFVPDFYHLKDAEINGKSYGVCTQKAALFVSFARALGFPARLIEIRGEPAGHMVAEVWIPEKGWTFIDPTWQFFGTTEDIRNYDLLILWSGTPGSSTEKKVEGVPWEIPGIYEIKISEHAFPFTVERDYPKYSKRGGVWCSTGIGMGENIIESIEVTWADIFAPSKLRIKLKDGSYFEKSLSITAGKAILTEVNVNMLYSEEFSICITSQGENYWCSRK